MGSRGAEEMSEKVLDRKKLLNWLEKQEAMYSKRVEKEYGSVKEVIEARRFSYVTVHSKILDGDFNKQAGVQGK